MLHSVGYDWAKKHTSNTNDEIRHVIDKRNRPETRTNPKITNKMTKKTHRRHLEELHISTGLPCKDKYHFILNEVMRWEEGNIRIQAQCVDFSIKLIPTQSNTHQSNSCCGSWPDVGDTDGCSGNTYALSGANSTQLILSVTFFASVSKL